MADEKLKEIKQKLEHLNDADRFEEGIALIETIPEQERDLEIQVDYARFLNNIAMITLGEYDEENEHYEQNDEDDENSPKIPYLQVAIDRLEKLKEAGKEDWYWNKRMANAYYSMGHVLVNQSLHYYTLALPYFQKWYELEDETKKKEALHMLDECRENLGDRYFTQKKYLAGFAMIDSLSEGWKEYKPCFAVSGIKEEEEKEIDDALAERLEELAEQGNVLLEQGNREEALHVWQYALDSMPEPKSGHAEVVWFEAAMGDIYFEQKEFHKANLLYERALSNQSGDGHDSFILMRIGECQYELGNTKFAKRFLLQAYMLEGEDIFKSEEQNLKYLAYLLEELKREEEAKKFPFKDFDFTGFWDDSDYALEEYVSEPPTDELIAEIEKELGYKLPTSYIYLMKLHNGGIPVNTCFPTETPTIWSGSNVEISGFLGIGREKACSLGGKFGSQFMIDEWGYPPIGVAICDTPTAGHDMIFLDYRECGPQGEPHVVHIAQELDYEITYLAETFEEFVRGLVKEDEFDFEDDEEEFD